MLGRWGVRREDAPQRIDARGARVVGWRVERNVSKTQRAKVLALLRLGLGLG